MNNLRDVFIFFDTSDSFQRNINCRVFEITPCILFACVCNYIPGSWNALLLYIVYYRRCKYKTYTAVVGVFWFFFFLSEIATEY